MTDLRDPDVQALARIIDPHSYWDQVDLNRNHRRRNTKALMAAHRALEWMQATTDDANFWAGYESGFEAGSNAHDNN